MSRPGPDEAESIEAEPADTGDSSVGGIGDRGTPDPTVGTGSVFAIGCVILLVVAVVVLGAIFFRP